MTDPPRWTDAGGGATNRERALLEAARELSPPPGAREATWAAISGAVAAPPAPKGASTTLKIVGGLVFVGLAAWLWWNRPRHEPAAVLPTAPSVSAIATPPAPPPAPSASIALIEPAPTIAPSVEHVAPHAPPKASGSSSLASRLKEESELLARARDAVRTGDFASARTHLDAARTKFPSGVLVQERRALEVELLYRAGEKAKADALADEFFAAYPNSPHAAHLRDLGKR